MQRVAGVTITWKRESHDKAISFIVINRDIYIYIYITIFACNTESIFLRFMTFHDASRLYVCFRSHARVGVVDLLCKNITQFQEWRYVSPPDDYCSWGDLIVIDVSIPSPLPPPPSPPHLSSPGIDLATGQITDRSSDRTISCSFEFATGRRNGDSMYLSPPIFCLLLSPYAVSQKERREQFRDVCLSDIVCLINRSNILSGMKSTWWSTLLLLHCRLDMCRRQYANDVCNRGTAGMFPFGWRE